MNSPLYRVTCRLCFKASPVRSLSYENWFYPHVKERKFCVWIKLISIWKASHWDSLWNRGEMQRAEMGYCWWRNISYLNNHSKQSTARWELILSKDRNIFSLSNSWKVRLTNLIPEAGLSTPIFSPYSTFQNLLCGASTANVQSRQTLFLLFQNSKTRFPCLTEKVLER